jgi:PAS domain S-box-containing protein
MARIDTGSNFSDCLTVGQAASYLGVSTATLRNWDRSGKLKPRRHPQNGYRIYLHEDLEAVLRSAELTATKHAEVAPRVDWSEMCESDHFVQFYENDDYLTDSVSGFVAAALNSGNSSIVVASLEHRIAIQRKLAAREVSVAEAIEAGRYVVLDARDLLSKIMVDELPNVARFEQHIASAVGQIARGGQRVHAFGEMVAMLWEDGNRHAAIRLEELWNDLGDRHRFTLFCAYPIADFNDAGHAVPFNGICACHSRVIPAESYGDIDSIDERLRAISRLQQKAQSLEAEIEHRAEIEKALSSRERELADFFENGPVGMHRVGPDGDILWANRADYEMLGYTIGEFVGHSITEFHVDSDVIADMLNRLRRGETLKDAPARLRCKDGAIKHVLIDSNACFENGKFAHTRCFTRDVTQQCLAENALREADRRKDLFLTMLAHELRNPLAPIRNGLEVLRLDNAHSRLSAEACKVMERQVGQITRLVDDLLDLSRIARDKIELRKERLDLNTIVKNTVDACRPLMDAAGHQLNVQLLDQPIHVCVDPTRMSQVLANLLNNSAKYTESGGRIEIEAKLEGAHAVIAVRDNGIGISRESLDYVFDLFHQADRSGQRAQGGLGIGLTLVRRLVEMHGGAVHAKSDGPGKGSLFTVRLPLDMQDAPQPKTPVPPGIRAAVKQRILVVDDNRDARETLSTLLRVKGHQVRSARSGSQAIEIASDFLPNVILMDIGMPHLNGHETTRCLRKLPCGRDATIIALTGWGHADDVRQSIEAGCTAHLVKPVDFAELDRLIHQAAASPN